TQEPPYPADDGARIPSRRNVRQLLPAPRPRPQRGLGRRPQGIPVWSLHRDPAAGGRAQGPGALELVLEGSLPAGRRRDRRRPAARRSRFAAREPGPPGVVAPYPDDRIARPHATAAGRLLVAVRGDFRPADLDQHARPPPLVGAHHALP